VDGTQEIFDTPVPFSAVPFGSPFPNNMSPGPSCATQKRIELFRNRLRDFDGRSPPLGQATGAGTLRLKLRLEKGPKIAREARQLL
jgi:hypothetical protein